MHLYVVLLGLFAGSQAQLISVPNLGKIQGFEYNTTTTGDVAEIYLNIPYAKPPVGAMRFEKPVAVDAWNGTRNGTAFGFDCVPHVKDATIPGRTTSEDCLTLNVFRPKNSSLNGSLPVLVWVHGGGFEIGSASLYGYAGFADAYIPKDMIVVTIQYRIGVLGFFSTGSSEIPGNLGLFDMALAFKFINQYIPAFGGDPKRVTAWGLSAGGCAAGQLALSNYSRNYISGVIEMSGSPLSMWAYGSTVPDNSIELAHTLGCVEKGMKNCMKNQTLDEINEAVLKVGYTNNRLQSVKWGPVVDGDFMTDYADKMIASGDIKGVPSLIGVSDKDAAYFMLMGYSPYIQDAAIPKESLNSFYKEQLRAHLRNYIRSDLYGDKLDEALKRVDAYYVDQNSSMLSNGYYLDQYNTFGSDVFFNVPASQEMKAKRKMNWPVYAYSFDHFNPAIWNGTNVPKEAQGSVHTNEYSYMFNLFIMGKFDMTGEELQVRDSLQAMIVSFTKTGIPAYIHNLTQVGNGKSLEFIAIHTLPEADKGWYEAGVSFWNDMCTLGFDAVSMRKTDGTNCDIDYVSAAVSQFSFVVLLLSMFL